MLRALTTRSPYHVTCRPAAHSATRKGNQRGHTRQGFASISRWCSAPPDAGPSGAAARPRRHHRTRASEDDAVSILANNLPVAKGTVVVNGNRIAVEVRELLPRPPDMR